MVIGRIAKRIRSFGVSKVGDSGALWERRRSEGSKGDVEEDGVGC